MIPIVVACFALGGVAGWVMRGETVRLPALRSAEGKPDAATNLTTANTTAEGTTIVRLKPNTTPGPDTDPKSEKTTGTVDPVLELRARRLRLPIEGAKIAAMKGQFDDPRGGGSRPHEAVDILAPRGTPIHAVEGGAIAKLFLSKAGGTTIYQFDPTGRFCYYYAHLQRYADNLREGLSVSAGDVIGYVGTSGNAPPNTPHLHFAVFELTPARHWWEGRPIDPYLVFEG
jgi:murein DD-endopeptidase MepM/ murein hydrolase activator NlpD